MVDIDVNINKLLQTFACELSGLSPTKRIISRKVNDRRFRLFNRQYKMHDLDEPFFKKKVRNFDTSSLPLCKDKLIRTHYE